MPTKCGVAIDGVALCFQAQEFRGGSAFLTSPFILAKERTWIIECWVAPE